MAIFLHFLNREVFRTTNAPNSNLDIPRLIRILAIAKCEDLFTNYSNLLEGGHLDLGGPLLIRELLASGQIQIAGERPSLAEFVDSRASRYRFDAARYPMYFGKNQVLMVAAPTYLRQKSATELLANEILSVSRHDKGLTDLRLGSNDIGIIRNILPRLSEIISTRRSSAITRSLFLGKLSNQEEAATARLISTLYISHYLEELNCDLATGIPGLASFDHLSKSPFENNLQLLQQVLERIGFHDDLSTSQNQNDLLFVASRGGLQQQRFAELLSYFLRVLKRFVNFQKGQFTPVASKRFLQQRRYTPQRLLAGSGIYDTASTNLSQLMAIMRRTSHRFAEVYESEMIMDGYKTVLLVTATSVETQAAFEEFKSVAVLNLIYRNGKNYVAAELGTLGKLRVIYVQCEPGSLGPSGSQAAISDAIVAFSPTAIIQGGIAFGANPKKQQLGDILVSKSISEYERVKLKDACTIPRGQRIESAPKLLSLFRAAEAAGFQSAVHVGVMLSGEKLIDSESFLDELLRIEPEAIGGEMEGAGLVAAAQRANSDWIVVKSIVDWGRNKGAQNDAGHQLKIARLAFRFIFGALNKIGL